MEKICMERVVLTQAAFDAWGEMARRAVEAARQIGIRRQDIADEEIWLADDKETLVIRCQVGSMLVSMEVPAGQWSWAN